MAQNPAATLIDRELARRLLAGSTPNRLLSLTLFPLFGFFYGDATPWFSLAAPFALHCLCVAGFILESRAHARSPDARSPESWRRRYVVLASLTGLAFGSTGGRTTRRAAVEPKASPVRLARTT